MAGLSSVILVTHILVAIAMIGVILLQRSEGGALGMGGGSGSFLSARSAGNVLTRTTTILVTVFFVTSMLLTILSQRSAPRTLDFEAPPAGTTAPQPVAPQPVAPTGPLPALPGFASPPAEGETPPPPEPAPAQ